MPEALPATMIAHLEALGTALLQVAHENQDAPLQTLEEGVLTAMRATLPHLLEDVVQHATSALQTPQRTWSQSCPSCGTRSRVHSWRPRRVKTICGEIALTRPWYVCPACTQGFSPVDATLQLLPHARLSAGLSGWLVDLGARTSFGEAEALLATLTGLHVSDETIRQHTERRGQVLEEVIQQEVAHVVRTREPAAPLDPAPGTLVVETDGVMVRYRDDWHEVKLGVVAGCVDEALVAPSYVAARAPAAVFGERLVTEAARRGELEVVRWEGSPVRPNLAVLRDVAILGDGAVWIWNLAGEHFGERIEIVDFYHASEHLWTVGKALYGDGTPATATWVHTQMHQLRECGGERVRQTLAAVRGETPQAAEVLRRERGYFRTNAARMEYPRFRALGLPIGSGAVESAAKNLVQQRMKRPGARWSHDGAQAVLNVRCRLLSGLPLAS